MLKYNLNTDGTETSLIDNNCVIYRDTTGWNINTSPFLDTSYNVSVCPYLSIDKVENGYKLKVFTKEYVFETVDNLLLFIKKELTDAG